MTNDNKQQKHSDSTEPAIAYSTCYAQPSIQLSNCDNSELMAKMEDESVDVILTDPPYLYLKNQKLERVFDEQLFFSECKRLLTKNGFIVMFGRGTSFYRWNTILDDLGFNFKEEIVWNKSYISSPLSVISRVHETVSIFTKGKGKINKTKVPYLEMKHHDIDSIVQDLSRLTSGLKNLQSLEHILDYLKDGTVNSIDVEAITTKGVVYTSMPKSTDRALMTLRAICEGIREKSIIKIGRDHYETIHPTQKPVRLLERLLALVIPQDKPKEEITILDPFGGSFSTMEAVYNMGMQGIACEIDKEYYELGKERIEKLPPRQTSLFT